VNSRPLIAIAFVSHADTAAEARAGKEDHDAARTASAHHPKWMILSARTTGVLAAAATVRSPASAVEAATTILDVRSLRRRLSMSGGRRPKRTRQSGQPAAEVPLAQDERAGRGPSLRLS
jgi:hypothetical protein